MADVKKRIWISLIVLIALATVSQAGTLTWDGGGADNNWSTAANWDTDAIPTAGDTVNISNGDTVMSNIGSWPAGIAVTLSGGSGLEQSGGALRMNGSSLHVEAGSELSGGFWDLNNGTLTFEDGAIATMDNWEIKGATTMNFNLGTAGFTTLTPNNLKFGNGAGEMISDATFNVDLSAYTGAEENIVLVDFGNNPENLTEDQFQTATLNLLNVGIYTNYSLFFDESINAILLAVDVPQPSGNVVITTPGLNLEFDGYGNPISVTNSVGTEMLSSGSGGFYLKESNGTTRRFNRIEDLGGNEYRFYMTSSPESFTAQFDGANDYMTVRFTSLNNFALAGERLYFGLNGLTDYGLKAMGLDYMIDVSNSRDVLVQRRSLWETSANNPLGGFAIYERIDDDAEDETLLDLWVDEGIAHPAIDGEWDRVAAEAWLEDWIAVNYDTSYLNIAPVDLAQHNDFLPYAQLLDAKAIYLNNRIWNGSRQNGVQDDEINPALYPNGLTDMEAFRDTLAANDMNLMFHYMSGSLNATDPEFLAGTTTVDPGVENWGTVTLDSAITSSSTSMTVVPDAGVQMPIISTSGRPLEAPPVIPDGCTFTTFRIGDEWITAESVTDMGNGTWQLNNVTRHQWNTTAQSYSAGTSLRGYIRNGVFISEPDSALSQTMASRWGNLSNTLGLTHASWDGASWRMVQGFWGFEKYATLMYQNLDHVTSSNTSHGRPPQAWLEYKFNRVKDAMGGDFQTREQISFFLGNESRTTPSLEEMEFNAYTFSQVNNRGFSVGVNGTLGVSLASLKNHGRTGEILYKLRDWKEASLGMSASQRETMNSFSAGRTGLGAKFWAYSFWRPEGSLFRRWYGLGTNLYNHEWYTGQEHGTVAPRFYVNNGEQVSLSGSSDLASGFNQVRVVGRVLPRFDADSANNIDLMTPMGLGSSLVVARTNTNSSASWSEDALVPYSVSLNLSGHTGIGMYVTGDGSGATLVVRLTNGRARDYAVPINFTGRQWVEIPTGEQGWRLRNWGWSPSTKKLMSYNPIRTISIGLGYVPAYTSTSVTIDGLKALDEISEPMVNPTITVGDQSVNVTGIINTGNLFILDPDGTFTIYDENWNTISVESLGSGLLPSNLATFKMESTSASSDTWLEIGVQAATETMANPAPDTTPPLITLLGADSMKVIQGIQFTDPGATAYDNWDGDMTASIVVSGSVDTGTIGTYILSYDVSDDAAGNAATTVTRTVNVTLPTVVTWTHAADTKWETAGNWDTGTVPVSGADSVVLNDTIGGASKGEAFISSAFTIGDGYSMTTAGSGTGEDLKLSTNAVLTLAAGGTLDIGILTRANANSSNMRFTVEAGATADVYRYVSGEDTTTEFIANAAGVTTVQVADSVNLDFGEVVPPTDALEVDLSSYDIANGNKLILFDYDSLVGTFATVTLTEGWEGTIDYAYDQGSGDLAIAITDLVCDAQIIPGDLIAPYGVDFADFAVFAAAWQSSEGDANWNESCNLAEPDDVIDIDDLVVFCENWLTGI